MKSYAGCAKKIGARHETIIDSYRRIFSSPSVPNDNQYWTMCSTHVDENGRPLRGSEMSQMIEEGLIKEHQFHGVDIEPSVIRSNEEHLPTASWHLGDFFQTMIRAKDEGAFRPSIVNYDSLKMPQSGGAEYVSRCLAMMSDLHELMVVANMLMNNPHRNMHCTPGECLDALWSCPTFRFSMENGWRHDDRMYIYGGTGSDSKTTMGTIIFWKE